MSNRLAHAGALAHAGRLHRARAENGAAKYKPLDVVLGATVRDVRGVA